MTPDDPSPFDWSFSCEAFPLEPLLAAEKSARMGALTASTNGENSARHPPRFWPGWSAAPLAVGAGGGSDTLPTQRTYGTNMGEPTVGRPKRRPTTEFTTVDTFTQPWVAAGAVAAMAMRKSFCQLRRPICCAFLGNACAPLSLVV